VRERKPRRGGGVQHMQVRWSGAARAGRVRQDGSRRCRATKMIYVSLLRRNALGRFGRKSSGAAEEYMLQAISTGWAGRRRNPEKLLRLAVAAGIGNGSSAETEATTGDDPTPGAPISDVGRGRPCFPKIKRNV